MSASSNTPASEFEGVRQRQVQALVEVVREAELATHDNVRRRYSERAAQFNATLAFLLAVGGVSVVDGVLHLNPELGSLQAAREVGIARSTLALLEQGDTAYRREMRAYLSQFRVERGMVVHRPPEQARNAESAVRNYLMDLGVVMYDGSAQHYTIPSEHVRLFVEAVRPLQRVTPAQLKRRLQEADLLGLRAEQAVLSYERERVGDRFSDRIKHVAEHDVSAGYDILSVTIDGGGGPLPRYIEVKAVSSNTWRFYWTANEVEVAKLFGSWYYLYLVPTDRNGAPDLTRLWILEDPFFAVLGTESNWSTEAGIVRCSLSQPQKEARDES